jgi:hypothetical protein
LRMVLAVDTEVNCWTIAIPKALESVPAAKPASNEPEIVSPSEKKPRA